MWLPRRVPFIALTFLACPGGWTFRASVAGGGVRVERIEPRAAMVNSSRALARPGDYVLAAGALRVTVAGTSVRTKGAATPGRVLGVELANAADVLDVQSLEPVIVSEGVELTLGEVRVEAMVIDGRATLELRAEARAPSGALLRVQRYYSIDARRSALLVRTRVEHAGGPLARSLAVGARLEWHAQAPFAPGLGSVDGALEAHAPWVARASPGAAFAWTQWSGELDLRFVSDDHEGVRLSGHTIATSAPRDLLPGRVLTHDGLLLAFPGDLVGVARAVALARGERVRETPVLVSGPLPGERALVTVVRADRSEPVLDANIVAGSERTLPLPDGEYVARAYAPGHAPGDPVRFLAREGGAPVELSIPPGGHVRYVARDTASGANLPVRIVVRGIDGTPDPSLGPAHEAAGAMNTVVAAAGRGEITLAPGRYELVFSHGPEWTIARARTVVSETLRGDVEVWLSHVLPMRDWTSCDLHVHSRRSFDSEVSIEDRVASLVAAGVEFAAATEHNTVGDYGPGVAALPPAARSSAPGGGLLWVPAVEVTTDGARQPIGHFNVYPYLPDPSQEDGGPPPSQEPPRQIFRVARANNPDAVIQVNHPRMSDVIGYFSAMQLDARRNRAASRLYSPEYDAIEVFNGFHVGTPHQVDLVFRDWLALLSSGARYVGTASSDSHLISYHQAGYPRTYVYTPGGTSDPLAVVRALRAGHAFGTSGPMVFLQSGDAIPGDTVITKEREVFFTVTVMAAPWIDVDQVEIYQDGERVLTLSVAPTTDTQRLRWHFSLPVRASHGYVLAVVRGDRPMDDVLPRVTALPFAFTNPIWIERAP